MQIEPIQKINLMAMMLYQIQTNREMFQMMLVAHFQESNQIEEIVVLIGLVDLQANRPLKKKLKN